MGEDELRALYGDYQRDKWPFFNNLAPSLFRRHPLLREIYEELLRAGGLCTGVSGSGSSLFGIFKDELSMKKGYIALKKRFSEGLEVEITCFLEETILEY